MTSLLIDHSGFFLIAALREAGGSINQVWLETPLATDIRPGDILCGRIRSVNAAVGAAFVDIGASRDGFLNISGRSRPVKACLAEGERVLVSVKRPAIDDKGCMLEAPARFRTLWIDWTSPADVPVSGISRPPPAEIAKKDATAKETSTSKKPGTAGEVKFYPSSARASCVALEAHLETLATTHSGLVGQLQAGRLLVGAGGRIPPLIALMARSMTHDLDEVIFGQADLYHAARRAIPRWGGVADGQYRIWHEKRPLLADRTYTLCGLSVLDQLDAALDPVIALPGGGRLVIEETAACIAVDIDLGAGAGHSKAGALLRLCDHAVPALEREIRRRQLGGQMIIDFPAVLYRHARAVEAQLRDIFAAHPGVRIGRMTRGGLLDITLPRSAASLREILTEPVYEGPLQRRRLRASYWADKAARALYTALNEAPGRKMQLLVSQEEGNLLELAQLADRFAAQFGPRFEIVADPGQQNGNADVI